MRYHTSQSAETTISLKESAESNDTEKLEEQAKPNGVEAPFLSAGAYDDDRTVEVPDDWLGNPLGGFCPPGDRVDQHLHSEADRACPHDGDDDLPGPRSRLLPDDVPVPPGNRVDLPGWLIFMEVDRALFVDRLSGEAADAYPCDGEGDLPGPRSVLPDDVPGYSGNRVDLPGPDVATLMDRDLEGSSYDDWLETSLPIDVVYDLVILQRIGPWLPSGRTQGTT